MTEVNWPEPADDPEIEPTHNLPTDRPYDQDADLDLEEPDSEGGEAS